MANNELDESLVALPSATLVLNEKTPNRESNFDENSPPCSPGEVRMMRNHPKVASVLFPASRKSLSAAEERKIKPKSFSSSIYTSPKGKTKLVPTEKRKTLQVLQPTASGDGTLVGSHGVVRCSEVKSKKNKSASSKLKQQKLKIHASESSTSPACTDSSDSDTAVIPRKKDTDSQIEVNEEAIAMMVSDPPPERYWELLAEKRRLALQEALEENERMHKELEEMKERNKALEEVAGQAEYFASLYQREQNERKSREVHKEQQNETQEPEKTKDSQKMVMEGEVPDLESSDATDEETLSTL